MLFDFKFGIYLSLDLYVQDSQARCKWLPTFLSMSVHMHARPYRYCQFEARKWAGLVALPSFRLRTTVLALTLRPSKMRSTC